MSCLIQCGNCRVHPLGMCKPDANWPSAYPNPHDKLVLAYPNSSDNPWDRLFRAHHPPQPTVYVRTYGARESKLRVSAALSEVAGVAPASAYESPCFLLLANSGPDPFTARSPERALERAKQSW